MRFARSALAAPAAVLALTSACLNDRPVNGLGDRAAIALRVLAPTPATSASSIPAPQQTVEVSVGIGCYNCNVTGKALAPGQLFDQTYPIGSGLQRVAATFPLAPCHGFYAPDNLGPYCAVNIIVTLRSDTTILSTQYVYNLIVRPGVVTAADSVYFGALTTGLSQRGINTRAGVVRYTLSASSAFGGIASTIATLIDSTGCYCGTTYQYFGGALTAISVGTPGLYVTVPGATAAQYQAQVVDIHGNVSAPAESQGIDFPNGNLAPDAYIVTSDTTADSLLVTAGGFSATASTQQVDFVVRSVPNASNLDTIYMVCSVPAPGQFSTVSGGCKRSGPHFTAALVVAVPVDSIVGGGFGVSCALGLACNIGSVYPQRRR